MSNFKDDTDLEVRDGILVQPIRKIEPSLREQRGFVAEHLSPEIEIGQCSEKTFLVWARMAVHGCPLYAMIKQIRRASKGQDLYEATDFVMIVEPGEFEPLTKRRLRLYVGINVKSSEMGRREFFESHKNSGVYVVTMDSGMTPARLHRLLNLISLDAVGIYYAKKKREAAS